MKTKEATINEEEFNKAKEMAEKEGGKMEYIHTFSTPFEYEGETYEKIHFDWASLTGKDGIQIENEMQFQGTPVVIPSLSGDYLIRMASRASKEKVPLNALMAMPISDYTKIRSAARSFLLKSE